MRGLIVRKAALALAGVSLTGLVAPIAAEAQAQATSRRNFDIPAQDMASALEAFGRQSGKEILFDRQQVAGKRSKRVRGILEPADALQRITSGSGLSTSTANADTFLVRTSNAAQTGTPTAQTSTGEAVAGSAAADDESAEDIVVTGTNIRGVKDRYSPVTTVTRDEIDRAGFGTVTDLVESLPQNFGGGVSPDQSAGSTSGGAGSSAVNLRGLGVEATLTLLNGRRLAPGGLNGAAVDISSIPVSAIERVEVLTDGASAIYGSDAIAGVVNFILRKDYNGFESRLRVGTITEGDGDEIQVGQTFGRSGDNGRILVSYEYASVDALDSNSKSFSRGAVDPTDLLPATNRHSVFASAGLNRGVWEFFADGYYNDRSSNQANSAAADGLPRVNELDVQQYGGTAGGIVEISSDWRAQLSATFAKSDYVSSQLVQLPSNRRGFVDDSVIEIWSADAQVEGSLFDIGGGAVRAVVGGQFRREKYDGFTETILVDGSPSGNRAIDTENSRDIVAAFAEVNIPLVGASNRRPGIERLDVNASGRYEDYSDFGSTFNPKLAVAWSPVSGLSVRSTFGKSFRAPRLQILTDRLTSAQLFDYIDPGSPTGQSVAFLIAGDRSTLEPEKSTSWTVGLDFEPSFAPGLRLRTTYFDIDYTNRIVSPFPKFDAASFRFFDHPLPVMRNPDIAALQAFVNAAPTFVNFTRIFRGGSRSDLSNTAVFIDARRTNATATHIKGLDVAASYNIDTDASVWAFSLNGTYIFNFEERFAPSLPSRTLVDTIGNPADLKLRGGIAWTSVSKAAAVSIFGNYVDSYTDNQVFGNFQQVDAWTTFDFSVRYDLGVHSTSGVLSGTSLTFSVLNLTDEAPPRISAAATSGLVTRRFAFDATNADPRGRSVAVQLIKKW